jgi:hypothetical protein
MRGVPQLAGDEQVGTLHDRRDDLFESSADFVLIFIYHGEV